MLCCILGCTRGGLNLHIAKQDIIMQVCMLPARVTCNGCVIVTCGDVVLICTILGAGVFSIECLGFWVSGLVFSLNGLVKFGDGFWATLVSNNCEGTDKRARYVVEGSDGITSGLGHDNAMCLSGAV